MDNTQLSKRTDASVANSVDDRMKTLLQAAFRPAAARGPFRDQLVQISLNILAERIDSAFKRGVLAEESPAWKRSRNVLRPPAHEETGRQPVGTTRVNRLDATHTAGAPGASEEEELLESEDAQARDSHSAGGTG